MSSTFTTNLNNNNKNSDSNYKNNKEKESKKLEIYSLFEKEIIKYQNDTKKYDFNIFLKTIFSPNIYYFCIELNNYYSSLMEKSNMDPLLIYDFCDKIVNNCYMPFLKRINEDSTKDINNNSFEVFCVYGLLLLNHLFVINNTILYNFELFFNQRNSENSKLKNKLSSELNDELNSKLNSKLIAEYILKEKLTSDFTDKKNEIVMNLGEICNYLKEINIKPASFYNEMLCDVFNLDENYNISVVDN